MHIVSTISVRSVSHSNFVALRFVISSYRPNYVSDQIPGVGRPRRTGRGATGPGTAAEPLTWQRILKGFDPSHGPPRQGPGPHTPARGAANSARGVPRCPVI